MSNSKQNDWVSLIINRFEEQLPYRCGVQSSHAKINAEHIQAWLVKISKYRFSLIFPGLIKILTRVNESTLVRLPGSDAEKHYQESQLIILDTLEKCLANQPKDMTRLDEALNVKSLLREICQFIVLDTSTESQNNIRLKAVASKVLHTVSLNFFNVVFNRISGRLEELSVSTEEKENPDYGDIELIQHISIDINRLIKILNEVISKFKLLKKSAHGPLINSLEVAIWNWMDAHPDEFGEIQKVPNEDLARYCETLFDILDIHADSKKGRPSVWSLQLLMLVLSPKVLEQIVNADSGAPCSPRHSRKKQFVDTLKRNINIHGTGKHHVETSAIALVKLCKASTYINMQHSNNIVFTLVQTVVNDLKSLMFNVNKPFSRGQIYAYQDIDIMTECFVSCFRLKPHNTDALKVCLSPSSPPMYYYVLVSALYRIIMERRLAWWPKIDLFYNRSSELRSMFTDTLNKVTHGFIAHTPLRMIQSLTLKSKDSGCKFKDRGEEIPSHKALLLMMVRLIHADPMLMLNNQGKPGHEIQSSTLELINGLVSLVPQTNMIDVAQEAMEALLVLHQPEKIEMWNPEAPINTFWDVSSQVLFSISQKMIQHQIVNYTDILKWLKQILICRNEFLSRHKEYANVGTHIPICKQAHIKLEVVFLMYLWSTDIEAVYTSMSCFSLQCEEADIRCSSDEITVQSLLPNYAVYQELSQAASLFNLGRILLQKRITAILRKLEHCVNGVQPAWEETFRNWEVSTKVISAFSKTKTEDLPLEACHRSLAKRRASQQSSEHDVDDQINEWANMTGFLLSVGGVLLQNKSAMKNSTLDLEFKKTFTLPGSSQEVQYCPVTQFINQLLRLLLCSGEKYGLLIQKHIKELVGHEMNPSLYPILFDQIKSVVEKFFDQHGQALIDPGNTQFIEHVVYIMKMVLEKKVDEPFENFGVTSIEGMILTIVRYVRYLESSVNTIHLKTKICQLVDVIMKRRDDLSFRQEIKFRNKMVEYLSDWIMGVSRQVSPSSSIDVSPVTSRDLDQACMEAVAGLLSGLPLQPEESDRGDLNEAKSQLFLKYFTLFMNLLNDCADASQRLEKNSSWQENEANKLNALRSAIIQAISNLLSANIDSGLMHSIVATHHVAEPYTKRDIMISENLVALSPFLPTDFSYSKDTQNRAAFMEVLTKMLQQGAEFNMLADSVLADRYEQLVQLITMISDKGELPIAMALANVVTTSQMDELARVFVTIFEAKHLLSPLLWNMFYREVEVSDCMQTLFRGNSLGSKIMAFCFKIYGASYLQNLLAPLIQPLIDGEVKSFEIDPARMNSNEDIEENRVNLTTLTQTVFDAIVSSGPSFPSQLRSMCHCLYQVLSKRFPQVPHSNVSSVGTVIFLRFINPAIVSPQESGIVNVTVPPHVKRGLMLMSKILQNIANHVEFSKEQHMIPFNDFLRHNFEAGRRFFIKIASDCETEDQTPHSMSFVSDVNVHALHRLLHHHQEKIGEYLSSSRDQKAVGRRPFDKLATLLAYLGPPEHKFPELHSNDISRRWSSLDLPGFEGTIGQPWLSAEEYKSIKNMNIFYQYGNSKNNNPVFYYIARRFNDFILSCRHEEVSNEKFMMYVIQTLAPYQHAPWELFIDFTHTGTENRFRTSYLKNWMCCRGINRKNLVFAYVYNCNGWVREYSKFHESILAPIKYYRNIVFMESITKINEYIAPDQQKLPGATLALEEDLKVFNGALKLSHKDTKVAIKVGPSTLQITHLEKTKVLSHSVLLNDVYYAAEIEEVCLVDDNQFTVTIVNDSAPLSFIHNDCDVIVQSIIHIRNRWELSQPESVNVHHKIRPKDVPGTLLNMALLNLGSSDPNLRSAAYNQLCALTAKFDLKIEGRLLETSGLCIPSNNTIFIKSVSETLATNETRLTLEFLDECIQSFQLSNIEMKHLCLEYMTPWLMNLVKFCKSTDETKKTKVIQILEKLISLTIQEVEMYPSIQAKIWGSIGKVSELIDIVLECFLKRSAEARIGSPVVEVLADTAVALASANVQLVARKIISKLCSLFEQSCISPTQNLENHVLWGDIMILSRYLLMLSFNNCLDVIQHLPYLFHTVTFLVNSGPVNMKASIHGLVINVIHSLCTCSEPTFSAETQRVLQMSLDEFSLRKYYPLFGISQVKSASVTAFRYHLRQPDSRANDFKFGNKGNEKSTNGPDNERLSLSSLEIIIDALLEIMEACSRDIPNCDWLQTWTELAQNFAFCYNPALQPRALIVYGVICKSIKDHDIRQLLRILVKALEKSSDLTSIEAPVVCLTRLQPLLRPESKIHGFLFWIGVSVLQLENEQLFETGLALIEQNLHILDSQGIFEDKPLDMFMMSAREPIEEWYFRTMDGEVGLSFKENFHFALVGHLIKGFRHPSNATKSRTARVLMFLLSIIAKPYKRDKFEVTTESIAYLTALVAVSEEVRSRCRLKHVETNFENVDSTFQQPADLTSDISPTGSINGICTRRQKSWELLDQNSIKQGYRYHQDLQTTTAATTTAVYKNKNTLEDHLYYEKVWKSLDLGPPQPPPRPPQRSSSLSGQTAPLSEPKVRSDRASVSNESNILLDPEIITDSTIQVLTLTVLSTLVKYSTDEPEMRILYQYLADGSVMFSKVFRVVYNLLDARLTSILQCCHDQVLLNSVQSIIHNMIACEDTSQDHLYYVHTCGFGGLWRFAGPFTKGKTNPQVLGTEMFANYLEAIVETILPAEEGDTGISSDPSTTVSLITLASPIDKEHSSS
ncbi:neurofibromin-like isoform X1 [Planococcus citri]|uniref:neurofibromin-like isoform X1 n=1 Tax=Planococcus citri TaxID=170843 RepID=UPI0031F96F9B